MTDRRRAALVLLGAVAAVVVLAWRVVPAQDAAAPVVTRHAVERRAAAPGPAAEAAGVRVLRAWDRARSAAYAAGSVRALRRLYVGRAGAPDVLLLRSYLRRGYRVEGIRMQLIAVTVRAHGPGRWLLRVTDRLAGGEAVGHGERVALPRDRASTRTVRLLRGADGRWRVASVSG